MATALVERYREQLPLSPSTPIVTLERAGRPCFRTAALAAPGSRHLAQVGGRKPDGLVQGPGMAVPSPKQSRRVHRLSSVPPPGTRQPPRPRAARAGLPALVLQPEGAVALGKLAQARAHGARLIAVRGSFDDALAAARSLAGRGTHALVNSLNPYRIEGQKTAAFEILDELAPHPKCSRCPTAAGATRAYAKGFVEADAGLPCILAAQSSERSSTVASAIRIATPVHEEEVTKALARTRGRVVSVSDDAILEAWRQLAHERWVFIPPPRLPSPRSQDPASRQAPASCVITAMG